MRARGIGLALAALLAGCGAAREGGPRDAGGPGLLADAGAAPDAGSSADAGQVAAERGLPRLRGADADAASRGLRALRQDSFGGQLVPSLAIRNLWVVWDARPRDDETYWADFNARYGSVADPEDAVGRPLGLKIGARQTTVDCLFCHAGRIAGQTLIGAPARVDLEGFYDDLVRLNARAPDFGFPSFPVPLDLDGLTGAAGAHDATGLGLRLAAATQPGLEAPDDCGHQRPAPWWTASRKHARYSDGSGRDTGYRTMMATLLAFGLSLADLQALDATFADVDQALLSLEPPPWPFEAPSPDAAARGRSTFEATCAGCHGRYDGEARGFPERVVPAAEVATDPARAACFTEAEAAWINASWFGRPTPMTPTGGYLAPALTGVWAGAPYLHNGSVPTLAALLDPALRPARWRRVGGELEGYDPEAVGLRFEEVAGPADPDSLEGRRVYDTARPGLSNAGHDYGAELTVSERADLLAYLRTL